MLTIDVLRSMIDAKKNNDRRSTIAIDVNDRRSTIDDRCECCDRRSRERTSGPHAQKLSANLCIARTRDRTLFHVTLLNLINVKLSQENGEF